MRENRLYGSVRGALGDQRPYRDPGLWGPVAGNRWVNPELGRRFCCSLSMIFL